MKKFMGAIAAKRLSRLGSALIFTVILIAALSLLAYAASGPGAQPKPKPAAPKPGEVTLEEASKYKCSSLEIMRERIKCRLKLAEENEYDYLPEECRAQINESREKCVVNYKKSQSCWTSLNDTERFKCAASAFGLVGTVAAQKAVCDGLTGTNRSSCILELRDRVDAVVKFRIYNLEDKAQRLLKKGLADEESVTNFVTAMEQLKQSYNDAKTVAEKKETVRGVQKRWQAFITNVKPGQAKQDSRG